MSEKKQKPSSRNSGKSRLNQSNEVLCICVLFQESRDQKREPETNDMFMTCFYHVGGNFKSCLRFNVKHDDLI